MEFNLTTDIQKSTPKAIVFNYEALKSELKDRIGPYKSLEVTEDDIKDAKADKANLNKLKKALNDKRIDVKRQYMTPLEEFENQVKELIEIIDSGVINIDTQVKTIDEKAQKEKLDKIAEFYVETIGDRQELLPLQRIIPEKWKNKGCKLEDIKAELSDKIDKFSNDIDVIKAMRLDCEAQMLDAYIRTLDMSAALNEKHLYDERQEALKKVVSNDDIAASTVTETAQTEVTAVAPAQSLLQQTLDVRFYNPTTEFKHAMRELCNQYNIKYGKVR